VSPQTLVLILSIAFLVLSLGIHEAAHAWIASLCGDDTAKNMGRLTLNPIPHIDPVMTILVPAIMAISNTGFIFGGAKPVPVNYHRLRHPLRDMMLVAIAGPISNFLLAIVFLAIEKVLVYQLGMGVNEVAPQVMGQACYFNLILAAFNMLPIPPLDGSRVMAWILPVTMRESYVSLERYGMLIVVGLLYFRVLHSVLATTIGPMLHAVDFLTGGVW
jgi:Zn-dependent protease